MLEVFRDSGFPVDVRAEPGELEIEFPAELGAEARARFEERERRRRGRRRRVTSCARPRSPSSARRAGRAASAARSCATCVAAGFAGPLYPVNPHAATIAGRPAFASIADVPEPVELAVIAVPRRAVLEAARECASRRRPRARRAVGGLRRGRGRGPGAPGRAAAASAARPGMRLVGPNCLGVLNTDPDVRAQRDLRARSRRPPGGIAFASQSGAFGIAAIGRRRGAASGLSSFVSMGDKADLSGNDFLRYWEQDPGTDVVLLYLESFGNPRRFGRIARRLDARPSR